MYGGNGFSTLMLVLYIIIKYPLKYGVLLWLFMMIMMLFNKTYFYACKGITYIMRFFNILLNPGDFNLIVFKIPNMFNIFMAFIDLFIGGLYLCIALLFFIVLGLVTLPFNIIFSL